jgi:hypothetical protein
MKTITLCGSSKFRKAWKYWHAYFTLKGFVVFAICGLENPTEEQKQTLDLIYLEKILRSDAIFVLDVGGYIGYSTKREIEWAKLHNKQIYYLSKVSPDWK